MSNVTEINQEKSVASSGPAEKANLKEAIRKLYIDELKNADIEGRELFTQVQTKQEEISYLQKVIQAINAGVVKEELDLTHNPELKTMLDEAQKRFGLKVQPDKLKYNASEWQRLADNTKLIIEDGNAQVQLKLNEVNRVNNKLTEIIKIFDSILKGLHHAVEEAIRGIK